MEKETLDVLVRMAVAHLDRANKFPDEAAQALHKQPIALADRLAAEAIATRVIAENTTHHRAHCIRALARWRNGFTSDSNGFTRDIEEDMLEDTAYLLREAYMKDHFKLGIYALRTNLLMGAGKYAQAAQECRGALAIADRADTRVMLGVCLESSDQDGIDEFHKVVQMVPQWALPEANLSVAHYLRGHWEKAIEHHKHAKTKEETYPRFTCDYFTIHDNANTLDCHCAAGAAYNMLGRFDEARIVLECALSRDPRDTSAHGMLGDTFRGLGEIERAVQEYQKGLALAEEAINRKEIGHYRIAIRPARGLNALGHPVEKDYAALSLEHGISQKHIDTVYDPFDKSRE